ncbi:hypothetical protein OF829_11315 [Sphingomonas sp. LB-2]|uniref:hypothetical protein n=1 Tax=Sphingomonas caeni TaxID=2984949 RepID=UPI0022318D17|nr:hypothetical protein [Sphingomonas caeni]MCW3847829.1 hypothetical protein [Sphingomonas caeni]
MKMPTAILAALPLLALAQPAAAQSVSTSSYRATLDFAGCALTANGADARALLATAPDSAGEAAIAARLAGTAGCGTVPNDKALRGAIAERVYLATYTAAPAAPAAGPAAPFKGSGNTALANWDITRCAATRDPVSADMLIRSELRSPQEKEAIKRFIPVIGACTPAGFQVGFDRERMRGLVAEGLLAVRAGGAQ